MNKELIRLKIEELEKIKSGNSEKSLPTLTNDDIKNIPPEFSDMDEKQLKMIRQASKAMSSMNESQLKTMMNQVYKMMGKSGSDAAKSSFSPEKMMELMKSI